MVRANRLTGAAGGLLAGAGSGLLLFLCFPPADLWPLAPVALVPLALHFARARPGAVAAASAAFGLVFNGLLLYWIRLFGAVPYVALTVVQTLWLVAALQIGVRLRSGLPASLRWLAFPLAYLLQEYARSHVPWGGFGWGVVGYTQHDNRMLLRLAAFTGVWGISLLLLAVNSALAEAVAAGRLRRVAVVAGGAAAGLFLLPGLLPVPAPDGPEITVGMVQGNVPRNSIDPNADDEQVLANHLRLTETADLAGLDLLVWPEGAFDRDPFGHPGFEAALTGAARRAGKPFLVGALLGTRAAGDVRNSTLLVDPEGEVRQIYVKQRLVPFGEFAPLRRWLEPLFPDIGRIPVDLKAGTRPTVFEVAGGKLAVPICYESTYPGLVRDFVNSGARLLVVSANFSSYDLTAASAQHVAFSQVRAAEQRMWVAHTSVSGISAVIGPDGRVLESTGLFEPALLTPTLRFATTTTLYARLGDWVPAGALLLTVAAALLPAARRVGRRYAASGATG